MARYRITFEVNAVDKDDALHWAGFIAQVSHGMKDVDVYSVYKLGPSLAPEPVPKPSSDENPASRDRDSKYYRFFPRQGA